MKPLLLSLILCLSANPCQAEPLQAGVTVNRSELSAGSGSYVFEDKHPRFDVSAFQKMPYIPTMTVPTRRKVIIDWYPWHCALGNIIRQNWKPIYDSMGRFPTPKAGTGYIRLTVVPQGIKHVELLNTCGDADLDYFMVRCYESVGFTPLLQYPYGTHRTEFSYVVPFKPMGAPNSPIAVQKITPIPDLEVYYE